MGFEVGKPVFAFVHRHAGQVADAVSRIGQARQGFHSSWDRRHFVPAMAVENFVKTGSFSSGKFVGIKSELVFAVVVDARLCIRSESESAHDVSKGTGVVQKDSVDIEGQKKAVAFVWVHFALALIFCDYIAIALKNVGFA